MIVELKSLMPILEKSLEESSVQRHEIPVPVPLPLHAVEIPEQRVQFRNEETASSAPSVFSAECDTIPRLLEELLKSSERNASSAEKIAELLELQENTSTPVYN